MAFIDKANYLLETKDLLRDAINKIGGNLTTTDTFRSYESQLLLDQSTLKLDFDTGSYGSGASPSQRNDAQSLGDVVTFTRSTTGGRFNELGLYEVVAIDTPRIDHDPATVGSSTDTLTLGYGEVTINTDYEYEIGSSVVVAYDLTNYMVGKVLGSSATAVTLNVVTVVGSGTYSAWSLIVRLGLLVEESRTNLLTNSEFPNGVVDAPVRFNVTASVTPDFDPLGTTSCIVYPYTPTSNTYAYKQFSATSGTPYTFSCLVVMDDGGVPVIAESSTDASGDFRVVVDSSNVLIYSKVEHVCGNVYKVIGHKIGEATGTRNYGLYKAMGNSTRGFKVTGYQLEVGTFPTSYIPTAGAAVTRAGEFASLNTAPWINVSEGTFVAEFDRVVNAAGTTVYLGLDNANRVFQNFATDTSLLMRSRWNSNTFGISVSGNNPILTAFAYSGDKAVLSAEGTVAGELTTGIPTLPGMIAVGAITPAFPASAQMRFRSIRYIPRRLTGEELQAITS